MTLLNARWPLVNASALILTACSTPAPPEPVIITQEVRVPVAIPCVSPDEIPPVRDYADQRLESPADLTVMLDALMEGISERDDDIPVLRALLEGCASD